MTAAVVLGGGRLVVTQAGTAACLIATVGAPDTITLERAVDALCGGAAGLSSAWSCCPSTHCAWRAAGARRCWTSCGRS
jgi:hypothetical protein